MLETITINNIVYKLGRAYLHCTVNDGTQFKHSGKIKLFGNDKKNLEDIFRNTDFTDAEKWSRISRFWNYRINDIRDAERERERLTQEYEDNNWYNR